MRLGTVPDVVDGDHGFQAKGEGQDMAGDKTHVWPLATERLPQPPVGPRPRKGNAAPLDTGRQPGRRVDRVGVDAHFAGSSRCRQRLDNAPRVNLCPSRQPASGWRSIDADDHRWTPSRANLW